MKKCVLFALSLVFLLSVALPSVFAADEYGMTFDGIASYTTGAKIELPATLEATVELAKGFEGRGGVIAGSYSGKSACFNFEIHENGRPRLYVTTSEGTTYDIIFDADVRTGKPVHVAICVNRAKKSVSLYVDGILKQTVSREIPDGLDSNTALRLGGDFRSGNAQYFKGKLYAMTFWSDVRTAGEIKEDMKGVSPSAEGIIASWDTSKIKTDELPDKIADTGPKSRSFVYQIESGWMRDGGYKGSYAYSFAVIGDTQKVTRLYPDKLSRIYDWLVQNAGAKKLKFVIGLGDITDTNKETEWETAKSQITKLDGVVPYSLVRGNHDGKTEFKNTFPIYEYRNRVDGTFEGNMLNTYQTFEAGKIKYLILNLDCAFTEPQIKWANQVVSSHPDYNVIVVTHIFLEDAENVHIGIEAAGKYGAALEPDDVWEQLVSKHENIVMVLCGHSPASDIPMTTKKGDNGNLVKMLLIDGQSVDLADSGPAGLVAMFYFSEDGKKVNVEYYSTVKNRYREGGNLSFMLNVVESAAPDTAAADDTTAAPDVTDVVEINEEKSRSGKKTVVIGASAAALAALAFAAFAAIRSKKK